MYEFDAVLQELGEFGCYQKFVFCLLCLLCFVDAYTGFALVFIAYTPNHRCKLEEKQNSTTANQNSNSEAKNVSVSECQITTFYSSSKIANSTGCIHGWEYSKDYFDETIITQWNLVCDKSILPKLMLSLFGVAIVIGCMILSQIQDKYGRKAAFLISLTLYLVGNILSQFTVTILIIFNNF